MLPQAIELKRIALDFLFPQRCVGCGKEGFLICPSCVSTLPVLAPPICPLCGRPQLNGILCPSCITWRAGIDGLAGIDGGAEIDGIRSPFRFQGVMRDAVHQLKYKNIRTLAAPLGQLLKNYIIIHPIPGEVLVPVPLHPKRLKERGYNQSALLARELGKLTNLATIEDCLIRQQHTSPQAKTATVEERRSNVSEAFACCNDKLRNKHAILIDDVATSGSTLNACAQALKTAGAKSVWGLTVAREI